LAVISVSGGAIVSFLGPVSSGYARGAEPQTVRRAVASGSAAMDNGNAAQDLKAVLDAARRKGPVPKVSASPEEELAALNKREETLKNRLKEEEARLAGNTPQGLIAVFESLGNVVDVVMSKFATRGGVIFLMFALILLGFGIKAGFEVLGFDTIQSGFYTTGVFALLSLLYTITYITRVLTKQTTFASQLKQYEREVLAKRVSELSDEELDALLEETGAGEVYQDVQGVAPESASSKKDKILYLIRNTEMPSADIREGLGVF